MSSIHRSAFTATVPVFYLMKRLLECFLCCSLSEYGPMLIGHVSKKLGSLKGVRDLEFGATL